MSNYDNSKLLNWSVINTKISPPEGPDVPWSTAKSKLNLHCKFPMFHCALCYGGNSSGPQPPLGPFPEHRVNFSGRKPTFAIRTVQW